MPKVECRMPKVECRMPIDPQCRSPVGTRSIVSESPHPNRVRSRSSRECPACTINHPHQSPPKQPIQPTPKPRHQRRFQRVPILPAQQHRLAVGPIHQPIHLHRFQLRIYDPVFHDAEVFVQFALNDFMRETRNGFRLRIRDTCHHQEEDSNRRR